MTTDHRAMADACWSPAGFDAVEHLLAAIHDLLADRLPTNGDPCPCGCRRDVEPKPVVSHDMTEYQDQINETIKNLSAVQRAGLRLPMAKGGPVGPSWPAEYTCDCGRALPCRHCPEVEAVTVTLPRDLVEPLVAIWDEGDPDAPSFRPSDIVRLLDAMSDALDAANGSQS